MVGGVIGRGEGRVVVDWWGWHGGDAGGAAGEDEVDLFCSSVRVAGGRVAVGVGEAGVLKDLDGAGAGFGVAVAADDLEGGWREVFENPAGLAFAVSFAGRIPLEVRVGDDQGLGDFDDLGDVAVIEFYVLLCGCGEAAQEGGAAVGPAVGFHLEKAGVAEGSEDGGDGFEGGAFDFL